MQRNLLGSWVPGPTPQGILLPARCYLLRLLTTEEDDISVSLTVIPSQIEVHTIKIYVGPYPYSLAPGNDWDLRLLREHRETPELDC